MEPDVKDHLGLAKQLAWKYASSSGIPFNEMLGEAYLGLLLAKSKYKPNENAKFATYAHNTIRNQIYKYINNVKKIRQNEFQMDYLFHEEFNVDEIRDEVPSVVKDSWKKYWDNWRTWGNVLQGIEKDIWTLVVKEKYSNKADITKQLHNMGHKFEDIKKAFININLQLRMVNS